MTCSDVDILHVTLAHTHAQTDWCAESGPVPPTISLNVSLVQEVCSCQHCSLGTVDWSSCMFTDDKHQLCRCFSLVTAFGHREQRVF